MTFVVVVGVVGFDAWKANGKTLAAAGELGSAFGIFGLLALGVAFLSLNVQQRQLTSQSLQLREQRQLQAQEIRALKAQAEASLALARHTEQADERQVKLELASRYSAWFQAVDELIVALWEEDRRHDAALKSGAVPEERPFDADRRLRNLRHALDFREFALRALEGPQHGDLLADLHRIGQLPEPLRGGAKLTLAAMTDALHVYRETLHARRRELARVLEKVEARLGLAPLAHAGDKRETGPEAASGAGAGA